MKTLALFLFWYVISMTACLAQAADNETNKATDALTPALIETGKVQHLGHPDPFAEWDGRAPEVLNLVEVSNQIPYPEEAKLQKVSGIVQLKILVDATGTYVRHIVVNPEKTHPLLVVAIEPYLTQLKFKPGLNSNAKPDLAWVQVPFRFTLTSY